MEKYLPLLQASPLFDSMAPEQIASVLHCVGARLAEKGTGEYILAAGSTTEPVLSTGITVTGMKAKLRRVPDLGMVVIDYLQLMQSDRRVDNRVQEVAEISRAMKIMAKDLMVPVICCAQLSRGPESRTDKKPMLSDLRDSGAIEQDADVVMFLYRDEYYKTNESSDPNSAPASSIAEVIIAKNRHGSTGTVQMGWIGKYTKFRTIEDADSTK